MHRRTGIVFGNSFVVFGRIPPKIGDVIDLYDIENLTKLEE